MTVRNVGIAVLVLGGCIAAPAGRAGCCPGIYAGNALWATGGTSVVFMSHQGYSAYPEGAVVTVSAVDPGEPRPIGLPGLTRDRYLAVSAGGTTLAYLHGASTLELATMRSDGTDARLFGIQASGPLGLSPDGSRIATAVPGRSLPRAAAASRGRSTSTRGLQAGRGRRSP
jgi:hypothetical protein